MGISGLVVAVAWEAAELVDVAGVRKGFAVDGRPAFE